MSEIACCAHIHVSYQAEDLPNVGTHGWWACDDCPRRFAPISNTLSDGETVRPIDDLNERTNEAIAHFNEARRRQDFIVNPTDEARNEWGAYWQAQWDASTQARCPVCKVPLDAVTPHQPGCQWQTEQARLARPSTRTYGNELTNACRPASQPSPELVARYEAEHTEYLELSGQPEEPAPASWWSRAWRWFR